MSERRPRTEGDEEKKPSKTDRGTEGNAEETEEDD